MKVGEKLLEGSKSLNLVEQTLKVQLQWLLFLRVVLYTLLLSVNFFFNDTKFEVILLPQRYLVLFILSIYCFTIGSAFFLNSLKGGFRKFGFIQCLIDTFFVSVLVFYTGSSHSIFVSVYFFPIIAGGLILPKKGGLLSAAASTLQFGVILGLETIDIYPEMLRQYAFMQIHDPIALINHFAVRGLTFFLAALLSALFATRLIRTEKALSDTQLSYDQLNILYKLVFDNISTGIITLDENNQITSANAATEKITGYTAKELIGKSLSNTFPHITLNKTQSRQATDLQKKDQSMTRIGYSHAEFFPNPIKDNNNTSQPHKVLTIQDISDIERLERKYRQSEKLAAIGMMSASIAHDFRNPIAAISGSAQVLSQEYGQPQNPSEQVGYELTEIIIRESKRLSETITNFLRFAKPEHAVKEWFSLHSCLNEVLQVFIASDFYSTTCKITLSFEETLDIWADNKQIFMILNELLTNAIAFCPPGNEQIDISAREIIEEKDSGYIEISVSDNGPGISQQDSEVIFEPFYTSRTDGTGLGLAIIRQTIEEHQGEVLIGPSKFGGTQISFRLPLP